MLCLTLHLENQVERLKSVVKDSLRRLQNEFGTTPISEFGNIHTVGDLHGAIEDLLRKEQSYIVEQRMFLRSSGYNRYISTGNLFFYIFNISK